jgi:hypothetical protein
MLTALVLAAMQSIRRSAPPASVGIGQGGDAIEMARKALAQRGCQIDARQATRAIDKLVGFGRRQIGPAQLADRIPRLCGRHLRQPSELGRQPRARRQQDLLRLLQNPFVMLAGDERVLVSGGYLLAIAANRNAEQIERILLQFRHD